MPEEKPTTSVASSSLLIRVINRVLDRFRYPVLLFGSVSFVVLISFYLSTGSMYPDDIDPFSSNPMEITGVLILLAVMPSYMLMCILGSTRLTNRVIENLKQQLGDQYSQISDRYRLVKFWPLVFALIWQWPEPSLLD